MQRRHVCASILGGVVFPTSMVATAMPGKAINSSGLSYAQVCLVEHPSKWLFISGQVPADAEGKVPERFEDQCRLVWHNIETQLTAAGMKLTDLVKVTVFLSDRQYRAANAAVRKEVLGTHAPASELLPRADMQGRLYFGSAREGGEGQGDIYMATPQLDGTWQVANPGPPVNTPSFEYEAEVSRDGSTLVVVAHRTERSHLYQYKWRGDRWVEVGEIPALAEQFQVGPLLSPTGDRLLFAQRDGERSGEMFLVDLAPNSAEVWPPRCR